MMLFALSRATGTPFVINNVPVIDSWLGRAVAEVIININDPQAEEPEFSQSGLASGLHRRDCINKVCGREPGT